MAQEIHVPDIGDFKDVEVIDVLVKVGDKIEVDTPLVTIETEKATMDVPSTAAGVIKSLAIKKGARVSKGSLVLTLEGESAAKVSAPVAEVSKPASAPSVVSPAVATDQTITVPDIGDFKDVEIIDVLIKVGDKVDVDSPLITIETEKATMDVPSTAAGVIKSIAVKKGGRVSKGAAVAVLTVTGAATVAASGTTSKPAPVAALAPAHVAPAPVAVAVSSPAALPAINEAGFAKAHASPSVRRFARELGVDLSRVKGNGVKGRITPDDVKAFVKQVMSGALSAAAGGALPKTPEIDFSKFGAIEVKPL